MLHKLAPMDMLFWSLSILIMLMPSTLLWHAANGADEPQHMVVSAGIFVLFLGLVYLAARPRGFIAKRGQIDVVFPLWTRRITGVVKAERIDRAELKRRYGYMTQMGVGGVWGFFGWIGFFWPRIEVYVSRLDGYVLLTRTKRMPLLISPQQPDQLCEQVQ